jgi:hypothetical protein
VAQGYRAAPVPFAVLTATPHAIAVLDAADEADRYVACGEIGGALTDAGALVIALESPAGAALGVAVLAPAVDDPDVTGVSIFLPRTRAASVDGESQPVSEGASD